MDFIQAIVLGIVEGVTEFLPISSTFHLIFASKLLGVRQDEFAKLFEVVIQSGAILSVLFLYFKELIRDPDLVKKTLASFLPTAAIGFLLYKVIKGIFFESDLLMLAIFIAVGVLFIIFENYFRRSGDKLKKTAGALTYKEAIIIGVVQALAVVPGVSRAGAVLLGMMVMGYRRDESARFSFILAVPTILAASGYDLLKNYQYLSGRGNGDVFLLLTGFLSALVSSYFVIKWLINYLKTNSLAVFGWYRIILGVIMLGFLIF